MTITLKPHTSWQNDGSSLDLKTKGAAVFRLRQGILVDLVPPFTAFVCLTGERVFAPEPEGAELERLGESVHIDRSRSRMAAIMVIRAQTTSEKKLSAALLFLAELWPPRSGVLTLPPWMLQQHLALLMDTRHESVNRALQVLKRRGAADGPSVGNKKAKPTTVVVSMLGELPPVPRAPATDYLAAALGAC